MWCVLKSPELFALSLHSTLQQFADRLSSLFGYRGKKSVSVFVWLCFGVFVCPCFSVSACLRLCFCRLCFCLHVCVFLCCLLPKIV